jgi:tyramine---L-glutamate ligase
MMRVFVYEHLTATGSDDGSSMYREGRAMRDALVADLGALSNVTVTDDLPEIAVVIAPETDRILEDEVAAFRRWHAVVASSAEALALTRDKLALARHWQRHGVPTPFTTPAKDWPLVVKPRDGAGSGDTFLIQNDSAIEQAENVIAQDFIQGRPASIAFLMGPNHTIPLIPTFQHLSGDGRFHYLGGELPIPADLAERAVTLGRKAVACVPGLVGYVGVDLILGDAGDHAIEINPRLTTSYIGLRELADFNLAAAMLKVFRGEPPGEMAWKTGKVTFLADGQVKSAAG